MAWYARNNRNPSGGWIAGDHTTANAALLSPWGHDTTGLTEIFSDDFGDLGNGVNVNGRGGKWKAPAGGGHQGNGQGQVDHVSNSLTLMRLDTGSSHYLARVVMAGLGSHGSAIIPVVFVGCSDDDQVGNIEGYRCGVVGATGENAKKLRLTREEIGPNTNLVTNASAADALTPDTIGWYEWDDTGTSPRVRFSLERLGVFDQIDHVDYDPAKIQGFQHLGFMDELVTSVQIYDLSDQSPPTSLAWSSVNKDPAIVLQDGDTKANGAGSLWPGVIGNIGLTEGKGQFELVVRAGSNHGTLGIADIGGWNGGFLGNAAAEADHSAGYLPGGQFYFNFGDSGASNQSGGAGLVVDSVFGCTIDFDQKEFKFYVDGVQQYAYTWTGTVGPVYPAATINNTSLVEIRADNFDYPIAGFPAWGAAADGGLKTAQMITAKMEPAKMQTSQLKNV